MRTLLVSALLAGPALAQIPAGYYDSVDTSHAATLRSTLHEVIDDHTRFPYTSGDTDTWDILELADENPANPGQIVDLYRNASYAKQGGGNSFYNREHTWPNSYGFPDDSGSNSAYTDCHQLFLCDDSYNGLRGSKPFDTCSGGCSEAATSGGGSGTYPGQSNWYAGAGASGAWETWSGRRGDVARALLYLDVRYEGGVHGVTAAAEPDLILTNDRGLIAGSQTGSNESVAYMGLLSTLLAWHAEDPVDAREIARNDVVHGFQGNRNPFIDHPEWVECLFGGACAPGNFSGDVASIDLVAGGTQLWSLDAGASFGGDFYLVLGSFSGTSPGFPIGGFVLPLNPDAYFLLSLTNANALPFIESFGVLDAQGQADAAFLLPPGMDPTLAGITLHHAYGVLAPGTFALQFVSDPVPVDLVVADTSGLVINEIDYDQPGTDMDEFIELYNAGASTIPLAGLTLELWNGATSSLYDTIDLSVAGANLAPGQFLVIGSSPVTSGLPGGVLSITFGAASNNIQNGGPDGLLLLDGATVLDGVSYEGGMAGIGEGSSGAGTDNGTESLARIPDGADTQDNGDDFVVTPTPTPGSANL